MVKEELVEGLRLAVAKGESLEKAMMSFYTAGYAKEDIEQAAAVLASRPSMPPRQQPRPAPAQPKPQPIQPVQPAFTPASYSPQQPFTQPIVQTRTTTTQLVSNYEDHPKKHKPIVTALLFFLLLFLLAILAGVIIFKDELAVALNGIFLALV